MTQKINIVTSCRDCVFAEYVGDTQDDCYLGRVTKFEDQGATVTGQDDGAKRYLVVDRFCNAVRRPGFVDPLPLPELAAKVRKEATARVAGVVYVGPLETREGVTASLDSLKAQSVPPVKAVVVLDQRAQVTPQQALSRVKRAALPFPWEVVHVQPWDDPVRDSYLGDTMLHAVDTAVTKLDPNKVTYYTVGPAGWAWPADYVARIDRAINDEMVPLTVVLPVECDFGYAVQTKLHNHPHAAGNVGGHVLTKVDLLHSVYGSGWRVMSYEDLPACE